MKEVIILDSWTAKGLSEEINVYLKNGWNICDAVPGVVPGSVHGATSGHFYIMLEREIENKETKETKKTKNDKKGF